MRLNGWQRLRIVALFAGDGHHPHVHAEMQPPTPDPQEYFMSGPSSSSDLNVLAHDDIHIGESLGAFRAAL